MWPSSVYDGGCVLFQLTAIFLGLAVWVMLQHSSATITIKTKEQSRLSYIRGWLRAALTLLLLLVLTWTFGLVFLDQRNVVMAYLFTVFNALLGIFIFALHCVQNEKVGGVRQYETPCVCRHARPAERSILESACCSPARFMFVVLVCG